MSRIYNFNAGPAILPELVLEKVGRDMLNLEESGMSIAEMSHRGNAFVAIAHGAEDSLRRLLSVPDTYHILFLQGGATLQFSAIPMNLLHKHTCAAYIDTGAWSQKAITAAKKYCSVDVVATNVETKSSSVPDLTNLNITNEHAYLHYTPNETIGGVRIFDIPDSHGIPLVADMSSMILSEPVDISRFALIYAGAQKNIGPAGLTIVIVRKDLCGSSLSITPDVIDYAQQAKNDSMLNTPPTFAWYMSGLVFEWIEQEGGLAKMQKRAIARAKMLYEAIDMSDFYRNPVVPKYRSLMNVPFLLADDLLNDAFIAEAKEKGLVGLEGHRSVGGMRASLYNAMPISGVETLITFMQDFARNHHL